LPVEVDVEPFPGVGQALRLHRVQRAGMGRVAAVPAAVVETQHDPAGVVFAGFDAIREPIDPASRGTSLPAAACIGAGEIAAPRMAANE
jgi:hypothetical protein